MYRKRYVAAAISIFVLGVVFGISMKEYDTFCFRALFIVTGVASVCLGVFFVRKDNINISKRIIAATFAVAAFSFGVVRVSIFNTFATKNDKFFGKSDVVTLEIRDVNDGYIDAKVKLSELGVSKGTNIRVYPENEPENVIAGDLIHADLKYSSYIKNSNYAKNIVLTASGEIISHEQGRGFLALIRRHVSNASESLYGSFEYAPMISKAVTIGDRSGLDSYIFSLYKVGGISHILAISGLHITLIVMSFYSFLSVLGIRKSISCSSAMLLAFLYVALVGFTPGAVRSTVMIMFLLGMRMFLQRSDNVTTLFMALLVLLIENPYSILSAGLQLSFLCSLSIIVIGPYLYTVTSRFRHGRKKMSKLKWAVNCFISAMLTSLLITVVSSLFTLPIMVLSFDCVSYISPLVNLVAVPLFSYAVGFALVAYVVSLIWAPLAVVVAYPAGLIFDFVTKLNRLIFDSDFGIISTKTKFVLLPLACSAIMIFALVTLRRRRFKHFVAGLIVFCISVGICGALNGLIARKPLLEYGDSGGEYIYLQTEEESIYFDIGGYKVDSEVVYENGRTAVDAFVIASLDDFTVKRMDNFTATMNVRHIVIKNPSNEYEESLNSQIKELANARNCDIIYFEDVYARILADGSEISVIYEDGSPLICFDIYGKKIRFLGDGFSKRVYCDIAVAMNGFLGSYHDVDCDSFYASSRFVENTNDSSESYYSVFDSSIGFKSSKNESDIVIYEP